MPDRKHFLKTSGTILTGSILPIFAKNSFGYAKSTYIKPKRLQHGATLGLIAPASPIYSDREFNYMLSSLKALGYSLKLGKHVRDRKGYLAGEDVDRVSDLHAMFQDPEVDGIICIRGGWGSNRLLPLINFDLIKKNPKVFVGFSDITSLHLSILKKTGLVTFHGPVGKSDWNTFTVDSWNSVLHNAEKAEFALPEQEVGAFTINGGTTSGKLLGGNLTVLTSMIGSEYLPDFKDAILFLEDVGEDVYRVDRMLTQLKLSGILQELNGFVFGKCTECGQNANSLSLKEVFDDHLKELHIPAFYGAMISHEEQNSTIPVGVKAQLNADEKTIILQESGVL